MDYGPHPQQTEGSDPRSQKPLQQSASLLQAPSVGLQFGWRQIDVKSTKVQMLEQQSEFCKQPTPTVVHTTARQMPSPQVLEQQLPLFWQEPPRFVQGIARQMPSPQIPEQQSLLAAQAR